jgi:hypothetical protein
VLPDRHGFVSQGLRGYITPRPDVLNLTDDSTAQFCTAGESLLDCNVYEDLPPSVVPGPLPGVDITNRVGQVGESTSSSFIEMFEGLDLGHAPAESHATRMGDESVPAVQLLAVLDEETGEVGRVNTPLVPLVGRDGREVVLEKLVSPPNVDKSMPSPTDDILVPIPTDEIVSPPGRTSTPASFVYDFARRLVPEAYDGLELSPSDVEELANLNETRLKVIKILGTPNHYVYPLVSKP